jgi:hypothetical protein
LSLNEVLLKNTDVEPFAGATVTLASGGSQLVQSSRVYMAIALTGVVAPDFTDTVEVVQPETRTAVTMQAVARRIVTYVSNVAPPQ